MARSPLRRPLTATLAPLVARAMRREDSAAHLAVYLRFLRSTSPPTRSPAASTPTTSPVYAHDAASHFLLRRPLLAAHLLRPTAASGGPAAPELATELALQLAATIAADGSLSEAVSALDDGKHTTLAAYGGPRVALSGPTGAQIPGEVRWTALTAPGGTAAAPSLSATGTLVIKGRSAIPGGNATVETHTDCECDNRQLLPLSFLV